MHGQASPVDPSAGRTRPVGQTRSVGQTFNPKSSRSLVELVRDLPTLLVELAKRELNLFTSELARRLKAAGIGVGFFVGAAFFGLVAFWVLVTAAVLGLAHAVPAWLAAIIVAVLFLIATGILAFLGIRFLKRGVPPVPKESVDGLKQDVHALKGMGKYDR
ncbi:phage holin family protein [Planctomonas psychrotolerans]|uniref:phage holin family protein n=1 Tax=Planctomonas psychrotolerans TaxID=2528712 RepID=UPI0012399D07|nr:phage holin family protein [Planctomonas psychrotolerans]